MSLTKQYILISILYIYIYMCIILNWLYFVYVINDNFMIGYFQFTSSPNFNTIISLLDYLFILCHTFYRHYNCALIPLCHDSSRLSLPYSLPLFLHRSETPQSTAGCRRRARSRPTSSSKWTSAGTRRMFAINRNWNDNSRLSRPKFSSHLSLLLLRRLV